MGAFNSSSAAWATTVEAEVAAVKRELAAADTSQVCLYQLLLNVLNVVSRS